MEALREAAARSTAAAHRLLDAATKAEQWIQNHVTAGGPAAHARAQRESPAIDHIPGSENADQRPEVAGATVVHDLTVSVDHTNYVAGSSNGAAGTARGALSITAKSASASEVRAAEFMADRGRNVVLRDPVAGAARGTATSDLLVDGVQWDVYTPTSTKPTNIIRAIAKKGDQVKGGGVVLDLSKSSVTAADLGDIMGRVTNSTSRVSDVVVLP